MKKLIVFCFLVFGFNLNAQEKECVKEGNFLIDGYYGFPNLYGYITMRFDAIDKGGTNIAVSGLGPLGAKVEYMLTKLVGIGIDFNYSNAIVTYDKGSYSYTETCPATRGLVGVNFHYFQNEKVEVYSGVKAGYINRITNYTSTQPGYTRLPYYNVSPIAARIETGLRMFFNENLGIHFCIGVGGGPVFSAGVTGKF